MKRISKGMLLVVLPFVLLLAACAGDTYEVEPAPEVVEAPVIEEAQTQVPEPEPGPFENTSRGNTISGSDPSVIMQFIEIFALDHVVMLTVVNGEEKQTFTISPSVQSFERFEMFYEVTGIHFDASEVILEQKGSILFEEYLALDEEQKIRFFELIAGSE